MSPARQPTRSCSGASPHVGFFTPHPGSCRGMTNRRQKDWCCEHYDQAGGRVGGRIADWWPILLGPPRELAIGRSPKFNPTGIDGSGATGCTPTSAAGIDDSGATGRTPTSATGIDGSGATSRTPTSATGIDATGRTPTSAAGIDGSGATGRTPTSATGIDGSGATSRTPTSATRIDATGRTPTSAAGIDGSATGRTPTSSATGLARGGRYVGSKPTAIPRSAAPLTLLQGAGGRCFRASDPRGNSPLPA